MPNGLTQPTALTVDPAGKYLYVVNAASPGKVTTFVINQSTGALTPSGPQVSAGTGPTAIAIDISGQFVYVSNAGTDDVNIYTVNSATGALTAAGSISTGNGTHPAAITTTGKIQ